MNIKFENVNWAKVAGVVGTLLSLGATVVSNYANEKKTDEVINDKVQKALENLNK